MTLVLVTAGAVVRASDSGLGCPDWPKCHGRWVPPLEASAIIEYSHRLWASVVGVLVLSLAIFAWLKMRTVKAIFWPAFASLIGVGIQGWIGRQVVLGELPPGLVALHFFTSMAVLGLLSLTTANALFGRGRANDAITVHSIANVALTFLVMAAGAFVSQFGAALIFPDWPLMGGSVLPPAGGLGLLHWSHRFLALALGITLGHFALRVRGVKSPDRALRALTLGALGLWSVQAVLGAINVLGESPPWAVVAHVAAGQLLWAAVIFGAVRAYRRETGSSASPETRPMSGSLEKVKAYFMLTKPRIIELLLITTVPSMVLAAKGWPGTWLVAATLFGGALTAGSANSINCFIDRDIDEKMERTSSRPLPRHQISAPSALRFGIVLGVIGFVWLWLVVNLPSALLATSAILFYVFVYSMLMKRSTPSNIVIGGAAGAVPVLVGWAAVTGRVDVPAWILFAIVFYWTPPHFWALALRYRNEYEAAGVPMLPVVKGVEQTHRQILLYSIALGFVSLLLVPVAKLGWVYLTSAVLLGGAFCAYALKLKRVGGPVMAMKLFRFSITYLVLLFSAMAVDVVIGDAVPSGIVLKVTVLSLFGLGAGQLLIFWSALMSRKSETQLQAS